MTKSIKPLTKTNKITGQITAPASKSMMQRAIAAALLAKTPTTISNATYCNDSRAALNVIRNLGACVEENHDTISIYPAFQPTGEILNCGESGLAIRMFTPIAALYNRELTLTGEGSLLSRPVTMIEKPLHHLGVKVTTTHGCPPLTVTGPLTGGTAQVDGSISSQFLTGLLMALPVAPHDSRLKVINLKSTPYIDMTLALLKRFQVHITHDHYQIFHIKGNQQYRTGNYKVEGDWSGAAFILVAGAIAGKVTVSQIDPLSPQADRKIIDALKMAGAHVEIGQDSITVCQDHLQAFQFNATHCPDLFPPLVTLACHCNGTSCISGVERLTHKESNRALVLQNEFSAIGAQISIKNNHMLITGKKLTGGNLDSHNDHRIAMAGTIAALHAENNVFIHNPECVAKSYPDFFQDFIHIGGQTDE